jgi:uncharacterized protein (TIGR02594 family)
METPSSRMTTAQKIYNHALADKGLKETPGNASTPRIEHAIRSAANWLADGVKDVDGSIAWCGCIMGLWMYELALGVPKEHYRAASWLKWGRPVQNLNARQGDVVVLTRKGGNHVALLDHFSDDLRTVYLLGGNQSNAVNVSKYDSTTIIGIRRAA